MNPLTRIISIVGALFFLTVLISSFVNYMDLFESVWRLTAALAAAFLALFLIHRVSLRMSRKIFLAVFLSLGFVARITWILWNPAPQVSDFLMMYNAALQAASGDFSFGDSDYFTSFPYQLSFTMYEATIIRLFGNHMFYLKLLNIIFSIGTAVVIYFTTSRVFNESCGRIATVVYVFYIPNIIMCSVLTNQHISTFLLLLGCLLLLRGTDSKMRWLLAGGLCLGLGNLMRPIGVVFLAAVFLYFLPQIWRLWLKSSKRQAVSATAKLACVFAAFYVLQMIVSASLIAAGVTHNALSEGDRYWKLMVGLNAETNGGWNLDDERYVNQYPFGEERNRAEWIRIQERLENKAQLAALMGRKLVFMWGAKDSSTYWSLEGLNRWDLERHLSKWEGPLYVLMCAFGSVAMLLLWRSEIYRQHHFFLILLLLYASAHLIVEIQTRYRLDFIPVVILLQSYGLYRAFSRIQNSR